MEAAIEHIERLSRNIETLNNEHNRVMKPLYKEMLDIELLAEQAFKDGGLTVEDYVDAQIRVYHPRIQRGSKNYERETARYKKDLDLGYDNQKHLEKIAYKASRELWVYIDQKKYKHKMYDPIRDMLFKALNDGGFEHMMKAYLEGVPIKDITA